MSMSRVRKALKIGAGVLLILVLGAIVGVVVLTRSSIGQAWVVEQVLRRIEGSLNGEIVVSGLRSPGLHRGARLLGVRVTAADGGPILVVDSVQAEYSARTMLSGDVALTGLTLWRPRLTITKEAPDQPFNLAALLDGTESLAVELGDVSELTEAGVRFVFDEVDIRDGSVDVRYPLTSTADPDSRFLSEPGPDGRGLMRVFGFHGIEGHLDGVVAADPAVDGLTMNVMGLALEGRVFEEPVQVQGLVGRVAWSGDRVLIDLETANLLGGAASGSAAVELVEGSVPNLTLDAVVESLNVGELRWLEPRLPDAQVSGRVGVDFGSDGLRGSWSTGSLTIDGGEIESEGTFRRFPNGEAAVQDVTLDVSAIPVAVLQEFVSMRLPLEGRVSGNVGLAGTMDSLRVAGRLDLLEPGAGPTGGEIDGILHLRSPLGVTGLTARVTEFDLALVNRVAEGLLLEGNVSLDVQADGSLDTGIRVVAEGTRPDSISEASRVSFQGIVQEVDEEIRVSLDGELSPLSMPGIFGEESPLSRLGVARGTVHAEGPLSALVLRSDLMTEGGRLTLEIRFDVRSPLASYRIQGEAVDYDAAELVPWLPQGTILSGSFDLVSEGGDLRSTELAGVVGLSASRFADLIIDTVSVDVRISNGLVTMDNVQGRIGGVTVEGAGRLAMSGVGSPEEFRVSFETENLEGLRPLLLGANVIAGDTLSVLERQILEFEGINPDTLPTLSEVLVSGRMAGGLVVGGSFENLSARGRVEIENGSYGGNRVEQAEVSLSATGLFSPERELSVQLDAGAIRVFEREFDSLSANFYYGEPTGNAEILLVRSPEESYLGRLAFEEENDVRTLHLDELVFRFPDERWNLGGPSTISWDADGLTFRDFRLRSPGLGGMRLQAQGRFPFDGEADFRLEADGLDVRRIARVLQLEEVLEGVVDLDLRLTGTDAEPLIDLALLADGFRFRAYVLDELEAELNYADRRVAGDVAVRSDSLRVLTIAGELPLNLSFNPVEERLPEEVIDLVVVSDLLPLSLLMAPYPGFQQVVGTMSGRVDVRGTSRSLAPTGRLTLDGGGAFLSGLGVRHEDVTGTLDWFPDGRLEVNAGARALGTATVEGTVTLTTALDPGLDLDVRFDGFQALDRRDATGRLSGDVRLGGSYSRPVISGDLFVDDGTLFWEEFERAAGVSDLFFERSEGLAASSVVDTNAAGFRPFIAGENPFLQNIRMENTSLTVRRDNWIRSELMDVELDGELDVLYDRQNQDLALVGSLEAVRGSYAVGYSAFSRRFQVDGGTLRFLGTPGIDPDLDLTATHDVRTPEGDRLTIIAGVTGTLVSPRVALSSEEPGFNEDDLLSYLMFGRPTYALTSGQSQALGTAAIGALGTLGLSSFSNQLGAVMTQGLGLDYLSITQQNIGTFGASNLGGALSTTIVQTGFYLADDMFLTVLFRPPSAEAVGVDRLPGLRFEWVPSESYTIETYFEDRFFRGRAAGFGELGVQRKGLGLSLFREWAY
jgi:translocation and assembly module TamB